VSSTYFLVLYLGLVAPVVAFGLAEQEWGLITTGYIFCALVGAVVLASGWRVHSRRGAVSLSGSASG
jgi:hypothetical protein